MVCAELFAKITNVARELKKKKKNLRGQKGLGVREPLSAAAETVVAACRGLTREGAVSGQPRHWHCTDAVLGRHPLCAGHCAARHGETQKD